MFAANGPELQRHALDNVHAIYTGRLPDELVAASDLLDQLFALRPVEPQFVRVPGGKMVAIPRRQAAFGANYSFAGAEAVAAVTPPLLQPFRDWVRQTIDPRMNGLLLNWYDGPDQYIGPHNDSTRDLCDDSPIVTITIGEERKFRMRPNQGSGFHDFPFPHGGFILIPYSTNRSWKHEVPKSRTYQGRRVSVTARCFERGALEP